MKAIYGPMHSWRLGECMNVDPICRSPKVCSMDCIYCMYGSSGFVAHRRSDLVPLSGFKEELRDLSSHDRSLTMRFSGPGETTLAKNLGRMLEEARRAGVSRTAVLTNSSLLGREEIRQDLRATDIVIAKLDAVDEDSFQRINRPHPDVCYSTVVNGLGSLSSGYKGSLRLQVMLMEENRHDVDQLADMCQDIGADLAYLSTPTRPSPVLSLSRRHMLESARRFQRHGCKVVLRGK